MEDMLEMRMEELSLLKRNFSHGYVVSISWLMLVSLSLKQLLRHCQNLCDLQDVISNVFWLCLFCGSVTDREANLFSLPSSSG